MLLMITAFVMSSTMAWAALDRANRRAKKNTGFGISNNQIAGFADL